MEKVTFKAAQESDLGRILDIYNYYIRTTTANFYHYPISIEEFRQIVFIGHEKYRTCLVYRAGQLAGFCFLTRYKKKEAYDRTAEIGVYIMPEFANRGLGRSVVAFLEEEVGGTDIRVILASICGENTASIRLFEKMGYEKCAHYRDVGEKFGRLLDVVDYQKILKKG